MLDTWELWFQKHWIKKKTSLFLILRKSQFCEFLFNGGKAIHRTAKTNLYILPRLDERFFNIKNCLGYSRVGVEVTQSTDILMPPARH